MKIYDWSKLGILLAVWLVAPAAGTACSCLGPKGPVPDDASVVVGTVLATDLAGDRWQVAVWPESVRDPKRCGDYVRFESADDSCRGRLPEIGARWAAASTLPGETLSFSQCSRRGWVDHASTQRWLAPLEENLHRCEAASAEMVSAAAEAAAKRFGTSDRTCEDSVSFRLFELTGSLVWQEPSWGEDGQVGSFTYRPDASQPPLRATLKVFSESRRKCWTRACLVQDAADAEPLACTYLRPGTHSTSRGTLHLGESDPFDISAERWVLRFAEVPIGPYFGGPGLP